MERTIFEDRICGEGIEKGVPFVEIDNIGDFSVAKTFDCGQSFRFEPIGPDEYAGVAYGRYVSFEQTGKGTVIIHGSTKEEYDTVWRTYLGFDRDYEQINRDILSRSDNPALQAAVDCGNGIHILRQEAWETVCSFIISQNNNIPRIKKIVAALSEKYGEPLGNGYYAFPTADALYNAGESGIFELKTGFRAKYIFDAAKRIKEGHLDLSQLEGDTETCLGKLVEVKGIGNKVAMCSLLFGFGHLDAFPIDVWIRRVTEKYFPANFKPEDLGPYAGVAQQYLFYYERFLGGDQKKM